MSDPATSVPPISDRSGVTDSVRAQILATEHWSLLATRSMTWSEIFTRAGMYITLLSASVVALALVAQATGFGAQFRLFALLILPVVLLMGLASFARLCDASIDDVGLLVAMNRLRHAYLELAPELEPYFTTGQHDDIAGIMQSMGFSAVVSMTPNAQGPLATDHHENIASRTTEKNPTSPVTLLRILTTTPGLVGTINVVVFGVFAGLVADTLGVQTLVGVIIGIAAALVIGFVEARYSLKLAEQAIGLHRPRFPH